MGGRKLLSTRQKANIVKEITMDGTPKVIKTIDQAAIRKANLYSALTLYGFMMCLPIVLVIWHSPVMFVTPNPHVSSGSTW